MEVTIKYALIKIEKTSVAFDDRLNVIQKRN